MYVPGNPGSRGLVWVDRQGRADPLPVEPDQILRATVSRDGRRIAYDLNRTAQWIVDLATCARTRITSDVRSWHGAWLPGDERLVVSSNRTGDWDLYTVGSRASGEFLGPLRGMAAFCRNGGASRRKGRFAGKARSLRSRGLAARFARLLCRSRGFFDSGVHLSC